MKKTLGAPNLLFTVMTMQLYVYGQVTIVVCSIQSITVQLQRTAVSVVIKYNVNT